MLLSFPAWSKIRICIWQSKNFPQRHDWGCYETHSPCLPYKDDKRSCSWVLWRVALLSNSVAPTLQMPGLLWLVCLSVWLTGSSKLNYKSTLSRDTEPQCAMWYTNVIPDVILFFLPLLPGFLILFFQKLVLVYLFS